MTNIEEISQIHYLIPKGAIKMKLGVFTCLLGNLPLEEALKYFKSKGIEMVEIGCGGYPGNTHANPQELLSDENKLNEFKSLIDEFGMPIKGTWSLSIVLYLSLHIELHLTTWNIEVGTIYICTSSSEVAI